MILELVTLGLMPRQVTPGWMCGLCSGQVATGKMLGLVTLGLMLGQVTPGRMCGLAIPGTISRRTVVYLSDPSITSSVFSAAHCKPISASMRLAVAPCAPQIHIARTHTMYTRSRAANADIHRACSSAMKHTIEIRSAEELDHYSECFVSVSVRPQQCVHWLNEIGNSLGMIRLVLIRAGLFPRFRAGLKWVLRAP